MILFQCIIKNHKVMESKEFNKQMTSGNNGFLHLFLTWHCLFSSSGLSSALPDSTA